MLPVASRLLGIVTVICMMKIAQSSTNGQALRPCRKSSLKKRIQTAEHAEYTDLGARYRLDSCTVLAKREL